MLKIIVRIIAVTCMGLLWFTIGIFTALNISETDIDVSQIKALPHLAASQFNSEDVRQGSGGELSRTPAEDPQSSGIESGPIVASCICLILSASLILVLLWKFAKDSPDVIGEF